MKISKNTKKMVTSILGVGTLSLSLFSSQALATPMLDFYVDPINSGTISYAGDSNPLVGFNIEVDTVVGLDTILNNNTTRACINCFLNFSTGASTGEWTWGGEGFITLTGTVDLNNDGIANDGDATGTLLNGKFGIASVESFTMLGVNTYKIAGSSFSDTKNEVLTNFYGFFPNLNYDGNFNLSFLAEGTSGERFSSTNVESGNISNTPLSVPVPELGTFLLLLLGSGLVGFVLLNRRRNILA